MSKVSETGHLSKVLKYPSVRLEVTVPAILDASYELLFWAERDWSGIARGYYRPDGRRSAE